MGFNRKTNSRPSKNVVLDVITKMCGQLKRQVSILEVSDKLRTNGYKCTPENVRHRMQDVRKAHKKNGTDGNYTARDGHVITSKSTVIQWSKEGTTPIEYFVGKVTPAYMKELKGNV